MINEWDYIRYGTISQGEQVVAIDPTCGLLSAREHAPLDRFARTFDAPTYVYIDEIGIVSNAWQPPVVIQTRRRDNDGPETVEVVLDRPIPMRHTTRFIFNDGLAINVVEYTFAPGDTNGNGLVTLVEMQDLQNCYGGPADSSGACLALDLSENGAIDHEDTRALFELLDVP